MAESLGQEWEFKSLRFGGTCVACQGTIEKHEWGWHARNPSRVMCTKCRPSEPGLDNRVNDVANPIGGSSALRVHNGKRDRNWRKGAVGEYLMDQLLQEKLTDGEIILTDRRVPDAASNIDHVVVAPSGVWIIDSKKWHGKIEYKASTATSGDWRLFVNGHDRTDEVDKIYALVIPVAQVIGDRSIPINAALCFIDGDWKASILLRDLFKKPYKHDRVLISPPRLLVKMIKQEGRGLDDQTVLRIGNLLNQRLRPM